MLKPRATDRKAIIWPARTRRLYGILVLSGALCGLAGAITIPIFFESDTILYKFGLDRLLLLMAQILGLSAGYLLIWQIILAARLKTLDRIFGLNNLFKFHRLTGVVVACLALIHPILIFVSDDRVFIPFELRYWPEFLGLFLMVLILVIVTTAIWRAGFRIAFHRWWHIHRTAAIIIAAAFLVHMLFVSETFKQALPRTVGFSAALLCALLFIWIRFRSLGRKQKEFSVIAVESAGQDAVSLKISPIGNILPVYAPGQFGFITVDAAQISTEEHPFTIASTPTRPSNLEFIIRTTGDWTAKLNNLAADEKVYLNGPYGNFSHLMLSENQEVVMIAGGIGITPMLSMLRYMTDNSEDRKITLVWSNKTRNHIIVPAEIQSIATQLAGLRIHHVLTRESGVSDQQQRLSQAGLEELLAGTSRSSAVFICGPDQMMKAVYRWLISMGFHRKRIFMERFSL